MKYVFGPPSPPPAPFSPPIEGVSAHPPLSKLPHLVDAAISEVRLHMYRIPEGNLSRILSVPEIVGRPSTNSTHLWRCMLQRRKHPWINLEWRIWNLLPDAVWTDDPEQATLFVVPHAMLGHACQGNAALTKRYLVDGMAKFLHHIVHAMPYYNRSGGRDHVTVLLDENGPLCNCETRQILAPNNTFTFNVLMSMMKIGHWAHHNQSMFGWQNHFDIAMPQFGAVPESFGPFPYLPPRRWEQVVESPKYSFGFSGSYWGREVPCPATIQDAPPESLGSKHVCACSPGTRTWLQKYMKKQCNSSATARPTTRCEGESGRMGTFWYALCPAAWACWSSRLYHAIDRLTVPVIMADGAIQPFEDVLDWSSFAVQLETTRLRSNNVSQLDWLHYDALNADAACSTCTTCHGCTRQPLVKRVRMLERVRPWFLYNGTAPYNAIGLLLIELHCRQASKGPCRTEWYRERVEAAESGRKAHSRRNHHNNGGAEVVAEEVVVARRTAAVADAPPAAAATEVLAEEVADGASYDLRGAPCWAGGPKCPQDAAQAKAEGAIRPVGCVGKGLGWGAKCFGTHLIG